MSLIKYISVVFIFLYTHTRIVSQNLSISGDFGVSCKTSSFANGYLFGINAFFVKSQNHHFGISLNNNFMSSDYLLPKNRKEANFHLRDYTNITPLGEDFNTGWNLDSFDPVRMKPHPNRYYNFNFGINYFYDFSTFNSLKIGSELILSYRDQMEIAKVLEVKEIEFWIPFGLTKYDYNIPIYAYDTYLDIGIAPYIQYNILKYKSLDIGLKTKLYFFPKSGEKIYSITAVFTWEKLKKENNIESKNHKKGKRFK